MAEQAQPAWQVEFYADSRGRCPALTFVQSLPKKEQAELLRVLELLQEFGLQLGMPHARPIAGLWELRAGPGRLFYVAHIGRRFIILHGYRKQSQAAPRREIETAHRRWADFLEQERQS
ncbi:MAG: type II toxin-antitoxin system RelE/ParE family toxin [Chloroflexi bacterium]|nr:MAG: type II toxin-antitoxin system RelE/ParE family toxin [Chloroflexota bacterium]